MEGRGIEAYDAAGVGLEEGSAAWSEWVKDYYRDIETYDWVDVADSLRGPEALFHRNRARAVKSLYRQYANPRLPVLDAGCGTGLNLRNLPAGAVGIDLNPRNIALIQKRLPDHPAVLGDIESLPFPDGSFGTIVCTEVLEHVPSPDRALTEFRRVLGPAGILIGSVPARSMIWRLRFLSSTCPRDEPFHHEYTLPEVRTMLRDFAVLKLGFSLMHFNVMFVARA